MAKSPDRAPSADLQRALDHHGAGRLAEARALYVDVLAADPDNAVAHHFLGVIAFQTGAPDAAVEQISKALAIDPEYAEAHLNLGHALMAMARLDDAVEAYRRGLAGKPDNARALFNMGVALQGLGRLDDAVGAYEKAIAVRPDTVEAHVNLGTALQALGRLDDALASFEAALTHDPDYAEAHFNIGNALRAKRQLDAAAEAFRAAVALRDDFAEAHNNLGSVLHDQGHAADAEACFRRALQCKPGAPEVLINLGNALRDLGRADDALDAYGQALAADPDIADAHYNSGLVLRERRDFDAAMERFRAVVRHMPDHAEAHENIADMLHLQGRLDDAEACYRRLLEIRPKAAGAVVKLGNVLRDRGFMARTRTGERTGAVDFGDGALWTDVIDLAERSLARAPHNTAALSLKACALVGLGRRDDWADLCDTDALIASETIPLPDGYADLDAFNEALLAHCADVPSLTSFEQSMTKGLRMYALQDGRATSAIGPLFDFLEGAFDRYRNGLAVDADHPFAQARPDAYWIDAFGSIMDGEGNFQAHIHPQGWLSGVYYGRIPDAVGADDIGHQGWIEFGRPPHCADDPSNPPFAVRRPEEGRIYLFPSYMFHQTIPFDAKGTRFSISFDFIPLG